MFGGFFSRGFFSKIFFKTCDNWYLNFSKKRINARNIFVSPLSSKPDHSKTNLLQNINFMQNYHALSFHFFLFANEKVCRFCFYILTITQKRFLRPLHLCLIINKLPGQNISHQWFFNKN